MSESVEREEYRPSGTDLAPKLRDQEVGRTVVSARIPLSRADLVAYAGASGDHNPIHWNERFAREVGLDDVIAHGMLSMGSVLARITEWAVDPGAIIDCRTRFTAPVVVADADSGAPDTPTAYLDMAAVVGAIDEEAGAVRLDISVSCGEDTVLGRTQAKVRLA
ncbi:MaoC/PaaZ C-terminal domain-containing protein [Brevibacterium luteolum]|uniref:Acyl dehydratase n=1 Tax=Brevibacterium luteolum TaxID=199591 RepID=A0A6G8L091_9MICO|nr:MaoC/PaaZ C-terminal domain-containing protein [Brevibacterium luteolum]QIN30291.1 acyl dehydratase [Brevibacterium luteolum]